MKPILFSTEMVRAILAGRKTQTRRVIKPQTVTHSTGNGLIVESISDFMERNKRDCELLAIACAPYQPGDILWVRETWGVGVGNLGLIYKADDKNLLADGEKWKSSIHMPREAARIFLRVKDVRVERVQDISEEDARSEGITRIFDHLTKQQFDEWNMRVHQYSGAPLEPPQNQQPYTNYLWHGHFGKHGTGNKQSDAWEYQQSGYILARDSFLSLWELINAKRGYGRDVNPWVWAIEFERVKGEQA